MSRVVVIGAGMGGLTAAARLAVKGHQVSVLERSHTAGGKVGRFERDGFVFDTGPSLLTLPQVYRDFFNKTGKPIEDALDIVELEPAFGYHWADGSHVVMPGADSSRCADALGDGLGGDAALRWRALMARAADMWSLTRRDFLESPLRGVRPLLRLAADPRNVRTIAPWQTLRGLGQTMLRDPRLVTLLDRYATYTGSDPRRAPAVFATIPYVEQTFGAHHVRGGIRALAEAVAQRGVDRGVDLQLNVAATHIETSGAAVRAVHTSDGRRLPADIVVVNADPHTVLPRLLSGGISASPERGPEASGNGHRDATRHHRSLSGVCIFAAVEGTTPGIAHHNVWFCEDYDDEFDSVFGTRRRAARAVPDPTVYACVPQDAQMSPPGCESWFILVNAPGHGTGRAFVDWDRPGAAQEYAQQVLARLAARGPDIRPRVRWLQVRTPADIERETGSGNGAIYGAASHGPRAAFTRPANESRIQGLYRVGGGAHPGGGLPLVGMGGAIVAELIGRV